MKKATATIFAIFMLVAAASAQYSADDLPLSEVVMEISWKGTGSEIYYRVLDCAVRRPLVFAPGQDAWETQSGESVTIADPADLENKVLCPYVIAMGESIFYLTVNEEGYYRYCEEKYLAPLPAQY